MNKTITILTVAILGTVGLMLWGRSSATRVTSGGGGGSGSGLTAVETLYDFGTISMARGNVTHAFLVKNQTDNDVTLKSLSTSCMCTTAYLVDGSTRKGPFGMAGMGFVSSLDEIIPPGGTREVDVVYDPAAHGPAGVGTVDRFVTVTDSNGGVLQLEIKAVVTP